MTINVLAIYEDGVFKPTEPVPCQEHEQVTLTIHSGEEKFESWEDAEFVKRRAAEADDQVSLEEARQALAAIPGKLSEEVRRERDERF